MNVHIRRLLSLALSTALFAGPAVAHDPKEHAAEPADPDCAAMKNMDHSKMDMSDPVMQAMAEKCKGMMDQPGHEHEMEGMEGGEDDKPAAPAASKHEGHHQ